MNDEQREARNLRDRKRRAAKKAAPAQTSSTSGGTGSGGTGSTTLEEPIAGVRVVVDDQTGEVAGLGLQLEAEQIDQGDPNAARPDGFFADDHAPNPNDDQGGQDVGDWGSNEHAEAFVMGNLLKVVKRRFMPLAVPPGKLNEQEQTHLFRSLHEDFQNIVKGAVAIIAGKARLSFRAEVESVNFKGPTDCKAALKLVPGPEAHALADTAGGFVTILIDESYDDLLSVPDDVLRGEPDTKPLFDEVHDGTSAGNVTPIKKGRKGKRKGKES